MMRALVALLLLANIGFFALSRGWLEPAFGLSGAGEREPQRLAAQIDPQALRLVAAPSQAAPSPATMAGNGCMQAGPFGDEQIGAAEAAMASLPRESWLRVSSGQGSHWLRLMHTDAALREQLSSLPAAALGGGFAACPP